MINLEEKQERVLLVGVETFENSENFESSMLELAELTKTAGGIVVDAFTQKRDRYDTLPDQTWQQVAKLSLLNLKHAFMRTCPQCKNIQNQLHPINNFYP